MANSIGWGQGNLNNLIGWGQSFINLINFGISYIFSYSGETWIGYTENAILFKSRVEADGGIIENLKCIKI